MRSCSCSIACNVARNNSRGGHTVYLACWGWVRQSCFVTVPESFAIAETLVKYFSRFSSAEYVLAFAWPYCIPTVLHCTVLCSAVLYCTVLHCTALHCTVLCSAVLHCTALHCTVLCSAVLYCTALHCTVLYCTALHCTALHCTVLYCTVLYCTVLYCTVLYCTVLWRNKIASPNPTSSQPETPSALGPALLPYFMPSESFPINMLEPQNHSRTFSTSEGLDTRYNTVLYCTVLYCTVLCCAVLCCAVLCCAVLCCAVLCCAVQCSAVQCCAVLYCTDCLGRLLTMQTLFRWRPPRVFVDIWKNVATAMATKAA